MKKLLIIILFGILLNSCVSVPEKTENIIPENNEIVENIENNNSENILNSESAKNLAEYIYELNGPFELTEIPEELKINFTNYVKENLSKIPETSKLELRNQTIFLVGIENGKLVFIDENGNLPNEGAIVALFRKQNENLEIVDIHKVLYYKIFLEENLGRHIGFSMILLGGDNSFGKAGYSYDVSNGKRVLDFSNTNFAPWNLLDYLLVIDYNIDISEIPESFKYGMQDWIKLYYENGVIPEESILNIGEDENIIIVGLDKSQYIESLNFPDDFYIPYFFPNKNGEEYIVSESIENGVKKADNYYLAVFREKKGEFNLERVMFVENENVILKKADGDNDLIKETLQENGIIPSYILYQNDSENKQIVITAN